jgi:PEP-CTERM motif
MLRMTLLTGGTRRWLGLTLALAAVLAVAAPAQAAPVEFAKFVFGTGSDFSFTNNGGTSGSLGNGTNTVSFSFTDPAGNTTSTFTASVAFTGTTTTPAGTVGSTVDQPINAPSTIKFTEIGGLNPGANLLSVTYTGDLLGQNGTPNIALQSSSNINTLVYSSDFLPASFFNNPQNFIVNLPTDGSNNIGIGPGGFLNSFVASNAQGQFFTSIASVPEPASMVMFGTGIAVTGLLVFRSRKRVVRAA